MLLRAAENQLFPEKIEKLLERNPRIFRGIEKN